MNILSTLNEYQLSQLERYYQLILETNAHTNLTAITERDAVYLKHFEDSLQALPLLFDGATVLDIGSGAGFPSIPLKIAKPDLKFHLIDSVDKKVRFVQSVIDDLKLENISVSHKRIEDIDTHTFDFVIARAVAPMPTLLEYSIPFLKVGGKLIAYKASDIDEELYTSKNAMKLLSCSLEQIIELNLAPDLTRKLVVIKKLVKTNKLYPRSKNLPRTKPL